MGDILAFVDLHISSPAVFVRVDLFCSNEQGILHKPFYGFQKRIYQDVAWHNRTTFYIPYIALFDGAFSGNKAKSSLKPLFFLLQFGSEIA